MKSTLVVVLFIFLGLIISTASQAEQIVIWHQKERGSELLKTLLKPVEEQFGVSFVITYISTNDLKSALITSALNHRQPDIAFIPSDFFGEYKNFQPLSLPNSLVKSLPVDDEAWSLVQVNERSHGVPLFIGNHMLLYYNKSLVKEPASTWQALEAQRLDLAPGKKLIGWNYGELFWYLHLISAFDAYPTNQGKVTLDNKEHAKALYFYRNLSRTGFISSSCDYGCSLQRFLDEEFAYSLNGDWAYTDIKRQLGDKLGISSLPSIDGVEMKSYFSAIVMVFLGREANTQLTPVDLAILNTLVEQSAKVKLFEQLGLIPSDKKTRDKLNLGMNSDYKKITEVLNNAIPLASDEAMSAAWAGMRKGFDYFHASDVSSQRAVKLMQTVAQRELIRLQGKK